jgi:putative ABC transport system permease protein
VSDRGGGPGKRAFQVPDPSRVRHDVDTELRFHLEERIEESMARGMTREQAEEEVRRRFGDPERIGSEVESIDRAGLRRRCLGERLHAWTQSLRYALRGLAARPGYSATIVLTLALAIGANTAIFSAVNAVLLRPLPVQDMERLYALHWDVPAIAAGATPMSAGEVHDLAARADLFAAVTGFRPVSATLTGAGEARRVAVALTMGDFGGAFGVRPLLGGFYGADASAPGNEAVAVISHGLWMAAAGGDPEIVGRTITVDDRSFLVTGVMRPDFRYPGETQIWRPLLLDESALSPERRRTLNLMVAGRLRPEVSAATLEEQLGVELARWEERYGGYSGLGFGAVTVRPFLDHLSGELRPVLLVLLGAVSFVLLIACANVASLQLVRTTGRAREIAVRMALGAGRGSVVRQFLVESLVFAVLGGAVGVGLGALALRGLARWDAAQHEILRGVGLNLPVLAFTAAVTLAAGLIFGVAPAWRASRVSAHDALKESAGRGSHGRGRQRLLQSAVVAQLALTLVLLVGSGVMLRSLVGILAVDPGFGSENVITMQITPPGSRYGGNEERLALYERIVERVGALPGVEAAALTGTIPFSDMILDSSPFQFVGPPPAGSDSTWHATAIPVTADVFRAFGIEMTTGRTFRDGEGASDDPVGIVDEQFARQFFPGVDPVGRRITHYGFENVLIVGVVRSVNQRELGAQYKANVYYPYRQLVFPWAGIVVRSPMDPASVTSMVAAAVREIDTELPVYDARTLRERVAGSVGNRSLAAAVLGGFAVLALALALLGTYGVLSYSTAQRTHELGIRVAVGARPRDVVGTVVRGGAGLAALGLGIGFAVYAAVARVLESMLYGVGTRDPLVMGVGLVVLLAAALLASWLPARRAARADPVVA